MRIGINGRFYAAPITGVQRVARHLAAELRELADTVTLVPGAVASTSRGLFAGRAVRGRLRGHAWEQLELPQQARRAGCDVLVHLGGTACLTRTLPAVVMVYDVTPLTHPEWYTRRFRWWFRAVAIRPARRATRVLTLSNATADELHARAGIPRDRIVVVRQGAAPFDAPPGAASVTHARRSLAIARPYVLAFGAGDRRKNVAFLIEVMRRWCETGAEVPDLVIVGRTLSRVHARLDPLDLPDGVRVVGSVDDDLLRGLYGGALAVCFPSLAEGFGRPPFEALACGTPAIAADYPAAREALGTAATILPLDPDRWVAAMRTLASDPGDGRDRRMAWARRFTWRDGAEDVLEALAAACANARGVP